VQIAVQHSTSEVQFVPVSRQPSAEQTLFSQRLRQQSRLSLQGAFGAPQPTTPLSHKPATEQVPTQQTSPLAHDVPSGAQVVTGVLSASPPAPAGAVQLLQVVVPSVNARNKTGCPIGFIVPPVT
jgi:hypothetical protein